MRFWCNALLSTIHSVQKEIISAFGRNLQKNALLMQGIFCYLLENNELPYGHELAYAMNCTFGA